MAETKSFPMCSGPRVRGRLLIPHCIVNRPLGKLLSAPRFLPVDLSIGPLARAELTQPSRHGPACGQGLGSGRGRILCNSVVSRELHNVCARIQTPELHFSDLEVVLFNRDCKYRYINSGYQTILPPLRVDM